METENLKYFAKWLPVEGEVKNGDMWIYRGYAMSPVDYDYDPYPQDTGEKVKQKVQLFLCSRDIKVGDKVSNGRNEFVVERIGGDIIMWDKTFRDEGFLGPGYLYKQCKASECFKVIGEISPNALSFVKEGDEFDERDISIKTVHDNGYKMELQQLKYVPKDELIKWSALVEIKGPCGHFH